MYKTLFVIFIICSSLLISGCAALEYFDGSSEREINTFKSNTTASKSNVDSQIEIARLKRQVDSLKDSNQKIKDNYIFQLEKVNEENKELRDNITKLEEDNKKISDEKKAITEKVAMVEKDKVEVKSPTTTKIRQNINSIKLKVLSGDGNIKSAIQMAQKLRAKGYVVSMIDYAPRSNFLVDTVYFTPSFKNAAQDLSSNLGQKSILKPLDWSSIYDLIVVTGRND